VSTVLSLVKQIDAKKTEDVVPVLDVSRSCLLPIHCLMNIN
jgi:hypothetical protein